MTPTRRSSKQRSPCPERGVGRVTGPSPYGLGQGRDPVQQVQQGLRDQTQDPEDDKVLSLPHRVDVGTDGLEVGRRPRVW